MASDTFDCGTNYLQPSGFKVVINRSQFPNLQFYAQSVSHPEAGLPPAKVSFSRIGTAPFVGDAIDFGQLQLEVLLDEDMNSYRELYNWMLSAVNERHVLATQTLSGSEYKEPTYHDITIAVLSSHNNVNRTFRYRNGFPISVGNIQMNASSADQFLSFPVTFRFDYFDFK